MTSDVFVFCVEPKPINDLPIDTEYMSSYSFQLCCLFQNYSKGPDPANKLPFVDISIHVKFLPNSGSQQAQRELTLHIEQNWRLDGWGTLPAYLLS